MELLLHPGYRHGMQRQAPESNLTMETAALAYFKIRMYLAMQTESLAPGWWPDKQFSRDLFSQRGFHYPVRWQPNLRNGWRRLTYVEFCNWYGLPER